MNLSPNTWLSIIIGLILFDFVFNKFLDFLNSRSWNDEIPEEMKEFYDQEKYLKARDYQKDNGKLGLVSSLFSLMVILAILLTGAFGMLDEAIGEYVSDPFFRSATFLLVLFLFSDLMSLPFVIYKTFWIEEKYGFNKTTPKTFIADKIKSYGMMVIIGGGILWVAIFLIEQFSEGFWVWLWLFIGAIVFAMNMLYADIILPIFNKLNPLDEGELKEKIAAYAEKVGYAVKNIYVIDGSKRSTKANAFFSGLGPRKTIALYDTLIEKHDENELVAILAHEVGHYKKKHIQVSMILSLLQIGLMVYLFELFIQVPEISQALGAKTTTLHIGILAFGYILSPLNMLMGIFMSILSRKNEYEADDFAKETFGAEPLIKALKKLSVDNLSNLYPHPAYVFVHYSHPPLLKRIAHLRYP